MLIRNTHFLIVSNHFFHSFYFSKCILVISVKISRCLLMIACFSSSSVISIMVKFSGGFLAITQGWSTISPAVIRFYGSISRHLWRKSLQRSDTFFRESMNDEISSSAASMIFPSSMTRRVMPSAHISPIWLFTFFVGSGFLTYGGMYLAVPLRDLIFMSSVPSPKSEILT